MTAGATVLALEASAARSAALIAAGAATAVLVALLIAFQFLDAVGGKRSARMKRSLGIAVPPLMLVLVAVLAARVVSILARR